MSKVHRQVVMGEAFSLGLKPKATVRPGPEQRQQERDADDILEQARQEAAQIILAAETNAQQLLQECEQTCQTQLQLAAEEGEKQGFEKGYEAGYQQAAEETAQTLSDAQLILEGAYTAKDKVLKSLQPDIAQLILTLGNRILEETVSTSPEVLLPMIQKAVDSLHLTGRVKVVVNESMYLNLKDHLGSQNDLLESMTRFDWVVDSSANPSQVFILTPEGNFDCSPNQQLNQLVTDLTPHLPTVPEENLAEGLELSSELDLPLDDLTDDEA